MLLDDVSCGQVRLQPLTKNFSCLGFQINTLLMARSGGTIGFLLLVHELPVLHNHLLLLHDSAGPVHRVHLAGLLARQGGEGGAEVQCEDVME